MSKAQRAGRARRRHRARLARAAGRSRKPMKMSDAIERITEPYVDEDMSIRAHRNLIGLCAMAWNLHVMERLAEQQSDPGDLLETAWADVARLGATDAVEELKKRKIALFPDDLRYVVGTSLKLLRDGGLYLNVKSISPEKLAPGAPASEPAGISGVHEGDVDPADAASPPAATEDPFQPSRTAGPS